jgi:hypothetical protein
MEVHGMQMFVCLLNITLTDHFERLFDAGY